MLNTERVSKTTNMVVNVKAPLKKYTKTGESTLSAERQTSETLSCFQFLFWVWLVSKNAVNKWEIFESYSPSKYNLVPSPNSMCPGNSTVVGPCMRKIQALHWQVVDTGVCLCVVFPLTLIIPASMGVNESWMRFLRVFEPVNTVFSITGPSVYCTVQSHRASWLDDRRCWLLDRSWTHHTDSNTLWHF